mgnify:FL=1|tara:strand:+ start:63 stop:335 length:273 start_codon:yes stop_codon:yes gene_type:complete
MVKVLVLKNDSKVLVTKIREVGAEVGEPDCELEDPVEFKLGEEDWKDRLQRWPGKLVTQDNKCMMTSDAILTIVDPDPQLLKAYEDLISE